MLFDLLKKARALNASDVHLAVGLAPRVRVQGALQEQAAPPMTAGERLADVGADGRGGRGVQR